MVDRGLAGADDTEPERIGGRGTWLPLVGEDDVPPAWNKPRHRLRSTQRQGARAAWIYLERLASGLGSPQIGHQTKRHCRMLRTMLSVSVTWVPKYNQGLLLIVHLQPLAVWVPSNYNTWVSRTITYVKAPGFNANKHDEVDEEERTLPMKSSGD